jgi:hypothetical protein
MAGYTLVSSVSTVQVLSPTVVNDVVYCTIETSPSGVVASIPVQASVFNSKEAAPLLQDYANNIEQMMKQTGVIAAVGSQTLDNSNLLADNVVFTVQYVQAGTSGTSVTADAVVPTGLLSEGGDPTFERVVVGDAEAIIAGVYANLKSAAGH